MGERVLCKHEVIGSIPFASTSWAFWSFGTGALVFVRRREKRFPVSLP